AIPRRTNKNVLWFFFASSFVMTPNTKGSIIAAVAVLEIHIERPALTPNSINTATDIRPRAISNTLSASA
ncbi:hypothetical protein CA163_40765, partial [Vibrio parahaemolyticus]